MTGSVEQLTQKLASLDQQTDVLKAKLDRTYEGYLQVLARVFQQQLLQACYHICTEGYPQEFVKLSLTQRYDLQQKIKSISKTTGDKISELLKNPPSSPPPVKMPGFFAMTPEQFLSGKTDDESEDDAPSFTLDLADPNLFSNFSNGMNSSQPSALNEILGDVEVEEIEEDEIDDEYDDDDDRVDDEYDDEEDDEELSEPAAAGRRRMTEADARELQAILAQVASAITAREPKTPVDRIFSWQEALEYGIREQIRQASYNVNQALQAAELIPDQVPDRALEAASRANGDGATQISHVIQMLVEMGNPKRDSGSEDEDFETSSEESDRFQKSDRSNSDRPSISVPKLTHVIALQVRLSELEFHDPLLMRWRRNIREVTQEVQSLTREYRKYQRKRSVAEAQVAWRSTWLSDR